MNVSLTRELEALVQKKVRSGMYHSASEVIREGLRLLKERDDLRRARLAELRTEIAVGLDEAARGEVIRCETPGQLRRLGAEVKAGGRRRVAKRDRA
jgi:antitoxin ParD1/3/4